MTEPRSEDDLTRFLRAASGRPFSWGPWDCLTWLGAWVVERRGVDPAALWRAHYRTALGAARILKRRGGAVAHIDACVAPFGILRTDTPKRGDIAVVAAPEGEMGAIITGEHVACLLGRGLVFRRLPIIAAWSI